MKEQVRLAEEERERLKRVALEQLEAMKREQEELRIAEEKERIRKLEDVDNFL